MKLTKVRRAFTAAAVVGAAVLVPFASAQTASATSSHCEIYLHNQGYIVGAKIKEACSYDTFVTQVYCLSRLNAIISNGTHVTTACRYARD
ncbi:hypothetical protein [Streptomyces atratus]|uniref:hypothetical protein n=1 Tax=Streptomyces atratus TaxID=1893 RepID=UPI00130036BB|nr:hypothetical protein [Streptomyces atratus]